MTRVLLTGSSGMLGSAMQRAFAGVEVLVEGGDRLAAMADDAVVRTVVAASADILVNCAAATDLEAAERDGEADWRANAELPRKLARACKHSDTVMIHMSSTGCYGDWKSAPYIETDDCRPTTVHHRHKIEGEDAIRAADCTHIIARTGWLYGGSTSQPKNFVWRRMLEGLSHERIVSDGHQHGCPTRVDDVSQQIVSMIGTGQHGTFNIVAQGHASRFEYVTKICALAELPTKVIAGPQFTRLAKVSPNEMATNARLLAADIDQMPGWDVALRIYIDELTSTPVWRSVEDSRARH